MYYYNVHIEAMGFCCCMEYGLKLLGNFLCCIVCSLLIN